MAVIRYVASLCLALVAAGCAGTEDDAAVRTPRGEPLPVTVSETRLCAYAPGMLAETVLLSPDEKRIAWVSQGGERGTVVLDGVEDDRADAQANLFPSPNLKRHVYIETIPYSPATPPRRWLEGTRGIFGGIRDVIYRNWWHEPPQYRVVEGSKNGALYDSVSNLIFSPDGKRLAYVARRKDSALVVLDGHEQGKYKEISGNIVRFSDDSRHLIYEAHNDDGLVHIITDGKESRGYNWVSKPVFSPASCRPAYLAHSQDKWFAVVDGVEYGPYDLLETGPLVFSPDGRHFAVGVRYGRKSVMVRDGTLGKKYTRVREPVWSANSECIAYVAKRGRKAFVVVNRSEGREYDEIYGKPAFTCDGRHIVYAARRGDKWYVVLDGAEGKSYDSIVPWRSTLADEGNALRILARRGNELFLVKVTVGEDEGSREAGVRAATTERVPEYREN